MSKQTEQRLLILASGVGVTSSKNSKGQNHEKHRTEVIEKNKKKKRHFKNQKYWKPLWEVKGGFVGCKSRGVWVAQKQRGGQGVMTEKEHDTEERC